MYQDIVEITKLNKKYQQAIKERDGLIKERDLFRKILLIILFIIILLNSKGLALFILSIYLSINIVNYCILLSSIIKETL